MQCRNQQTYTSDKHNQIRRGHVFKPLMADQLWDQNKEAIPTIPSRHSSAWLWQNVCNPVKTPRKFPSNSYRQSEVAEQ